jgi:hypothetical protein
MKHLTSLALFLVVLSSPRTPAQVISQPNYGLKSHETLSIKKIELSSESCKLYMSIENKIANGYFCADKNIYIIYPDGSRSKIISSANIPVCPETHKFTSPGEKLEFTLTFPALKPGTQWFDLIEDCNDNCFSFYGVTIDEKLNSRFDEAFALADNDQRAKALEKFISIEEGFGSSHPGIEGFIYVNIITLSKATGDNAKASVWYSKMKSSNAPRLEKYVKYLTGMGIVY